MFEKGFIKGKIYSESTAGKPKNSSTSLHQVSVFLKLQPVFTVMTCRACSPSLIMIQTCSVKGCPPAAPAQDLDRSSVPGNLWSLPRLRDAAAAFLFAERVSRDAHTGTHTHVHTHTYTNAHLSNGHPTLLGPPKYKHRPSTCLIPYPRPEDPYLTGDPA